MTTWPYLFLDGPMHGLLRSYPLPDIESYVCFNEDIRAGGRISTSGRPVAKITEPSAQTRYLRSDFQIGPDCTVRLMTCESSEAEQNRWLDTDWFLRHRLLPALTSNLLRTTGSLQPRPELFATPRYPLGTDPAGQ